jgi:hypothetical protein
MKSFASSLPFVYFDSAFLQTTNDKAFVVLEGDFAIAVEICHLHPALNILLGGVDFSAHHPVGFDEDVGDLVFAEEAVPVSVKLLEEPLGNLESLLDIFGVVPE